LVAKAMIGSPSKLFMGYGEFVGEGFELGIRSMIPDAARAASALVASPDLPGLGPVPAAAYGTPGGPVVQHHYHDNRQFFALEQGQYAELLAKAERGGNHAARWQQPQEAAAYLRKGHR